MVVDSGPAASPRRGIVVKTAAITVVATFLMTQAAGWLVSGALDGLRTKASSAIQVESSGPQSNALGVMVPLGAKQLQGVRVYNGNVTRWSLNQGGGPSNTVTVGLTIWGTRDHPVLLTGLRATDVVCGPAPSWTIIRAVGGGDTFHRLAVIDLDSDDVDAIPKGDDNFDIKPFRFPLQVSTSDLETITVSIGSDSQDCYFKLEVLYQDAGKGRSKVIDDDGDSFHVVSTSGSTVDMAWENTQLDDWLTPVAID